MINQEDFNKSGVTTFTPPKWYARRLRMIELLESLYCIVLVLVFAFMVGQTVTIFFYKIPIFIYFGALALCGVMFLIRKAAERLRLSLLVGNQKQ